MSEKIIRCPSCKVDLELHHRIDFEDCLRRLAMDAAKLKTKASETN